MILNVCFTDRPSYYKFELTLPSDDSDPFYAILPNGEKVDHEQARVIVMEMIERLFEPTKQS